MLIFKAKEFLFCTDRSDAKKSTTKSAILYYRCFITLSAFKAEQLKIFKTFFFRVKWNATKYGIWVHSKVSELYVIIYAQRISNIFANKIFERDKEGDEFGNGQLDSRLFVCGFLYRFNIW